MLRKSWTFAFLFVARVHARACSPPARTSRLTALLRLFGFPPCPQGSRFLLWLAVFLGRRLRHSASLYLVMCSDGEKAKLAFMQQALAAEDPLQAKPRLVRDVAEALAWRKSVSAEEAIKEREEVTAYCELAAAKLKSSGAVAAWKGLADAKARPPSFPSLLSVSRVRLCVAQTQNVIKGANGPFIAWLAQKVGYNDSCEQLLQKGGELFGNLKEAGIGDEKSSPFVEPLSFSRYAQCSLFLVCPSPCLRRRLIAVCIVFLWQE